MLQSPHASAALPPLTSETEAFRPLPSGTDHAELWTHGPATVRELHTAFAAEGPVRYNTLLAICARLLEKGLLERRRVTAGDLASRAKQAYVYVARVSEADTGQEEPPSIAIPHHLQNGSEREAIEQLLVYLCRLRDDTGRTVDAQRLAPLAALLERAESAERAVLIYQAEALRANARAASAERRAEVAEGVATQAAPRRAMPVPSAAVYEHPGNVCRVCGRPAPPPSGRRYDTLRVCSLPSCQREARRRDNVAKQRRSVAKKRAQQV
jgi:Penicillinase repressor